MRTPALRRAIIKRFLLAVMVMPVVLVCIMGLAHGYRVHLSNRWLNSVELPVGTPEHSSERILVFAPHCDDETLGVGGTIHSAVKAGANVKVVVMTNGDGFRVAAERALKKLIVTPDQYVHFAYIRQRETLEALSILGVKRSSVTFMGYPDKGLSRMWTDYWDNRKLFKSYYTKRTSSPYINSYTRNAPYYGESVLHDVSKVLEESKPTTVYIPHPLDAHPDHYGTYCFVMAAIEQLKANGNINTSRLKIRAYIVHRGDWPVPKGYQPKLRLSPPFSLVKNGTLWESKPLDEETIAIKKRAILAHKTQVAIMKNFLLSFARSNELFGEVKTESVPRVPDGHIAVDGRSIDWEHIPPCIQDPTGDNLLRDFYKAADVNTVYMCADSKRLYIRTDFVRNISSRITYRVRIRGIGAQSDNDARVLQVLPGKKTTPDHLVYAWRARTMEITVPLDKLAEDGRLFVAVETAGMGTSIDRTGWRALELAPASGKRALQMITRL